ncbi:MAG: hypothetical protein CH104c_0463 [Candidatus Woesebacteria bacterium]|jgi:DNA-binding transcriptional ArsR family regulator|nr:MAG: hypothetical protein CH104c_0463 [Candidatus Woesebacteria bacterium]
MASLSDIITSRVRVKLLELFFSNINELYHVRGIAREIKEEINAVRLGLEKLEKAGVIKKEVRGNRVYYWPRQDYPFFEDILSMVAKTTGIGEKIIENRRKIGNVNWVMFSERFVKRERRLKEDEVDILVVGDIVLPELASLIRYEEASRNMEINYTVMSREEFEFRKKRRDPFLLGILSSSRIMIIGDQEGLVE